MTWEKTYISIPVNPWRKPVALIVARMNDISYNVYQYLAIYNIAIVTSKCDDRFDDNVYQDLTIAIATTKCGDPFGKDV